MMDRTSKFLLLIIAIGVWANFWIIASRPSIGAYTASYVSSIANGDCANQKLCWRKPARERRCPRHEL